jgi:hypothetical protein
VSEHPALRTLSVLLVLGLGCATTSVDPTCPEGLKPVCGSPADLYQAALDERDLDRGYRYLALIHTRYPESDEDTQAFPFACALLQRGYLRDRFRRPDSAFVTTEPEFMFGWLESFFEGDEYPSRRVEELLVGLPYGLSRRFLAYAGSSPTLSRWTFQIAEDDGIIESVTALPAS